MFHRRHTDKTETPVPIENLYAGPQPSACWLIGGGPSLSNLPCDEIAAGPVPKMAVNLAGTRLIRPTFWTSYDPTARFHRSIYLDAGIQKFVHTRRAMDLVPGTSFKVCECPSTLFFPRDRERGFADFLSPNHAGIVDWNDSLVQALDILYRLGFRKVFLAGCEMVIRPTREQTRMAASKNVRYNSLGLFGDFLKDCESAGVSLEELECCPTAKQYHFDERKPLKSAATTDAHYHRIAQMLRLCRRSMSLAGFQLISVTPHSRLNDDFPYVPVRRVLKDITRTVGNPLKEPTRGQYTSPRPVQRRPHHHMRDCDPPGHSAPKPKPPAQEPDLLIEDERLECLNAALRE